ncbi:MAG: UxaA family hydrolase [Anaerolineae bacterium]|nr:UxaA family hydrolase [Anaerolineae bacterium]
MTIALDTIGRLPVEGDNAAIATQTLNIGTVIQYGQTTFEISHAILEGHRFAIEPIMAGDDIMSWGLPFGKAIKDIQQGEYLVNQGVITELGRRSIDFELPTEANFTDTIAPFVFDTDTFVAAEQVARYDTMRTFMGYQRSGKRGVGTRNMIVLLGTSSLTAGFVRTLETYFKTRLADYPHIDGIVAVAHTEGEHPNPNNRDMLLRTLAGFMVHPNVAAVLAVDYGTEAINNEAVQAYIAENKYPIDDVPHHFMSLSKSFKASMEAATEKVNAWLPIVNTMQRTEQPLSELKIALQCGGSDAFSGVSGNPLAAWVAHELIRYGGSANLAETDELIGAESYILDKVKDIETSQKFLRTVARFVERTERHGHSAEGNPSGGNKYRGLYNIYLKSLGAAAKRHPDVRLDAVIDYGEAMTDAGYYFMDSPGNDLESIAGQVAAGCNMIYFVTGNGSITNFPFVPTIKIVTTTRRYELLADDMDVNAGVYLDGTPIDEVGAQTLDLTVNIASGQKSAGEKAHHAQVQIWRNWQQTENIVSSIKQVERSGHPLSIEKTDIPDISFEAYQTKNGIASDQIALILPTSLCSGHIARMATEHLNTQELGRDKGISRFVTLVHTEGCGVSTEREFEATILGYLTHPLVRFCVLLEHGCEKTHNGYMRQLMAKADVDIAPFGWASVQMDGGIQAVLHKMENWFHHQVTQAESLPQKIVGLEAVRVGLLTRSAIDTNLAHELTQLTRQIVSAGGTVVIPENDNLIQHSDFLPELGSEWESSLAYAQQALTSGLHMMDMPTEHWGETLTGLGAAGVEVMLALTDGLPLASHPMIPVLQVAADRSLASDFDMLSDAESWSVRLREMLIAVLSRQYTPQQNKYANVNFQITRGRLGVSL